MQEWYLPITILPALGMLILSTTSQMMTLSNEINGLLQQKCTDFQHLISSKKLKQLGLLTRAGTLLYLASGIYVLSGILGALLETNSFFDVPSLLLYMGTIFLFIAFIILIIYAFRTVRIRQLQFDNNHNL
ncbi:hypothetical protein [Psychroserpens sp.]|uniref:hypothetical protein n=1 Tax=Psychroserpens sp. TaxID=2020870 RepID=UPI001B10B2E8|nr:hypothetical protein [Psychroserpens sp.]MBO6605820.1 hypothetical protein [Psychroserpens sp.]MBO6630456.1 hypothetical protein [Psychroserpens sp.]MBO6652809.1 hypothetical protein [Psychroserpens sp.]MBO6681419.1 hypothetical protein [Psychroserpens sp.]MBO6749194.1 hypothetical protein [Psychroserpens sp.]